MIIRYLLADDLVKDQPPGIDLFAAWPPVSIATPRVSELSFHVPQPEVLRCAVRGFSRV